MADALTGLPTGCRALAGGLVSARAPLAEPKLP